MTDAKSQRKMLTYDSLNHVTMIQRGTWSGTAFTEDLKKRSTFTYGTAARSGRAGPAP